ncbi:MAG TPA: helix-turn-helix transcriptional regulator [Streptosporangiaceae bacterium]|nr:helix-turn-helix transcriptional regulator [Streptosporangiaceae bacterium]
MPVTRELDPSAGPLHFFGAEVRRARAAAGLSQEQLGQRIGYSAAQVGKVETGDRAPALDFAQACDVALPDAGGLFARIYELARRWDGGYPSWFTEWLEAERRATSLRTWEPLLVPGLLQTADYARALFEAWRSADSDEELDQLVSARIQRQSILERAAPPTLWVVLDEAVLHRCIGGGKIMFDQLLHLADKAGAPKITIQVIPAEVGAHVGLLGAFAIASVDSSPGIVYMESPDEGQTAEKSALVAKLSLTFDTLRAEALPRRASQDLIRRVAEERWTQ